MTETPVPNAAVEIAAEALRQRWGIANPVYAEPVVDALARAGWLCEPERLAALETVADAARTVEDVVSSWSSNGRETVRELAEALAAIDAVPAAVPAAETTSGEQDLQFHCTHSTHEVAPLRCGGRHYGLPCGPGCAPVVP